MVLKRLLVTALGALGLGALAAGTALGQGTQPPGNGNIPAPNLFDEQIACSMLVPPLTGTGAVPMPSVVPKGGMTSPLDMLVSNMGMATVIDTTATGIGKYPDLTYTVGTTHCGGADSNTVDATKNPLASAVATGYAAVRGQYVKVTDQEAVVALRQAALKRAQDDVTPDNPNTVAINTAQTNLNNAQTELGKRVAALNAISTGPIYQAGIAEWRASDAVATAVTNWNKAVNGVTGEGGALGVLDDTVFGTRNDSNQVIAGYVKLSTDPSGSGEGSVGNVLNDDGTVNIDNMRKYADVGGIGTRITDNFNDNGTLAVPMRDTLDPGDGNAKEPALDATTTIADIRADRDAANNAVAALEAAQAKNENANLTLAYAEALRRARLEAAHLNAEWAKAIADTDDKDDETKGVQSIASRYAAYQKAVQTRNTAEATLRTSVANRESKTADLITKFTSPASFYQQLVDRRQAQLDAATGVVNRITAAGGTPTTAQTKAVTTAQTDLATANTEKGKYDYLVSDSDNPAVDLIGTLVKTNGDDGQALVDAIGATYGEVKKVADSVAGLTGDGGSVSQNTTNIATNKTDIATNAADIATNKTAIETNASDIDANETAIAKNAGDITALDGRVTVNEGAITKNASDIMTNAGNVAKNEAAIMTNAGNITANAGAINGLGGRVGANETAITGLTGRVGTNETRIGELNEALETVRAGVAASMALAGMPAINGRGISIGVGSYDGESAFAVGFQIQGEMASFKVGVTSSGGETGASAGVGFQF